MILSAQSIRKRCLWQKWTSISDFSYEDRLIHPMIKPFVERGVVRGRSHGLSSAGYDICVKHFLDEEGNLLDRVRMNPGDFVLASSAERIIMPKDLICIVHDKSSWAREGLAIQNTVLEPGWEGYITLELSFHRPKHSIKLQAGDPIAQLIFHRLDEPTDQPYNGKYQNQEDKPVEAKLETSDAK